MNTGTEILRGPARTLYIHEPGTYGITELLFIEGSVMYSILYSRSAGVHAYRVVY